MTPRSTLPVTSPRRRPSRRALFTGALAAAAASLAGDTTDALAGTYPMYACDVPGVNLQAPTRAAWGFWDTGSYLQIYGQCETERSTFFQMSYPFDTMAQGAAAGLRLDIPSSGAGSAISIARVTDWTETALTPRAGGEAPAVGVGLASAIGAAPGGSTSGWNGATTSGPGHDSGALQTGTKSYRIGVVCSIAGAGYGGCTLPRPFLRIRGLRATLTEPEQPSGALTGGSLVAGGALRGTRTLTWTAADDESGVRRVDATLDGIVVASEDFHRDHSLALAEQTGACEYVALQPCPASRTGVLSVNTAAVPDGAYELGFRVTDASGNTASSFAGVPVVIDNVPDTVPPTTSVDPAGTGVIKDTPAAVAAAVPNGTNATASAVVRASFAESRRGTVRSRYGRHVLITGRIATAAGRPIAGAKVAVLQQDKVVGAAMVPAGEVTTDGAGTFRYVAKAERSRTVRFGYRAHLGDTAFAHTTDIALGVIPSVSLTASARSLRNGQAVRFSGRIAGAPATARKVVELQVRKGRGWMTFRSTRLRQGRYGESYRFTRTRGVQRYVFRARVREEAGFPFLTGVSKSVGVTVRG